MHQSSKHIARAPFLDLLISRSQHVSCLCLSLALQYRRLSNIMHRHLSFVLCITAVLLCLTGSAGAKPLNFQQFFPRFNAAIQDRLQGVCLEQYQYYQEGFSPVCEEQGRQKPSCRASRVIDCVTAELKESWKANSMASISSLAIEHTKY